MSWKSRTLTCSLYMTMENYEKMLNDYRNRHNNQSLSEEEILSGFYLHAMKEDGYYKDGVSLSPGMRIFVDDGLHAFSYLLDTIGKYLEGDVTFLSEYYEFFGFSFDNGNWKEIYGKWVDKDDNEVEICGTGIEDVPINSTNPIVGR